MEVSFAAKIIELLRFRDFRQDMELMTQRMVSYMLMGLLRWKLYSFITPNSPNSYGCGWLYIPYYIQMKALLLIVKSVKSQLESN